MIILSKYINLVSYLIIMMLNIKYMKSRKRTFYLIIHLMFVLSNFNHFIRLFSMYS